MRSGIGWRVSGGPALASLASLALAVLGCGGAADARRATVAAVAVRDDAGDTVRLARPAHRVISLVPSATEMLVALGATADIVGRTRYDTEAVLARVPSVGGGLDPSLEAVVGLSPDLVVSWSGTRNAAVHTTLARAGAAVYEMRTRDTADVFAGIGRLARLTARDSAGAALAARLRAGLDSIRASVSGAPAPTVLFVLWGDPPMTAGPQTFIAQLIGAAGGRTVFPDLAADWPQVSVEEIVRRAPDYVVIPAGEAGSGTARITTAPGWRDLRAVREGHVIELPADLVNRPGPQLVETARRLRDALHPDRRAAR